MPSHYQLVPTRLQERLPDGRTRCHLCPWRCGLRHGQRGFCQAHVNRHGTLYNLSYGIISSLELSRIEDKPVRHFRPGTQLLNVGSYGCSFRCGGCHNLDISWGVTALDELARGESTAAYVTPAELAAVAQRQGAQGIAFTYSEPAVWLEYLLDASTAAHAAGLYTVSVSNSFITPEALALLPGAVDVLCSDIKSLRAEFYRDICGAATPEQVLDSIAQAAQLGLHVETRTNVIPGRNDSPDELRAIARWIRDHLGADSPWHITRFFPAHHLAHLPPTDPEVLWRAHDAARAEGLRHVYVYADKGCDCARDTPPVSDLLGGEAVGLHAVKKCAASCCGETGVLLKKYELPGADTA
jgi:pyruvate formate lyase activating enzyme